MNLPESIAHKLGGARKTASGWNCKCPVHDDKSPSLSIATGDRQELVFHCKAGCDQRDVMRYLINAGLLPKKDKPPPQNISYYYTDEHGEVLFEKVRYPNKQFKAFYTDNAGNKIPGSNGHSKSLYKRHTLNDLSGKQVVIVEGEKDCEFVISHYDILCTSPPNGSQSWHDGFNPVFMGADVVIMPDNDEPGLKLARQIYDALSGIANSVKIVTVPKGKDVSEWAGSKLDFEALISQSDDGITFSNADEMADLARAPHYLINKILETDSHGILAGASMAFKSFMAITIAHAICNASDFFGHKTFSAHKVIYICGEGRGALSRRMKAVKIVHGGFNGNLLVLDGKIRIDNEDDIRAVNVHIQRIKPALVIFDTFSSMNSQTNENDNSEVAAALGVIHRNISNGFTSSMIVHHFGKDEERGIRGASAFTANSDFIMLMKREDAESMRVSFKSHKTKDGESFDEITAEARIVDLGITAQDGNKSTSLILDSIHDDAKAGRPDKNTALLWSAYDVALADDPVQVMGKFGVKKTYFMTIARQILGENEASVKAINRFLKKSLENEMLFEINNILVK